MPIRKAIDDIVAEMRGALADVSAEGLERLTEAILQADRVYVAGGGRSGLMARALAMRLMHLGRVTYVVGETTTPAIQSGDLLLACSASGETHVTVLVSRVAREAGARVFAITATPDSPMARQADETIIIPAPSKHAQADSGASAQYGGSLFEQALLVVLDAVSVEIGRRLGTPPQELDSRHANLE
ncbi:MAG TPA: 6-phospho-3-hexuloisomerase [Phycisphaerae bacterium]|nr:6-phospho-3-hexuloisomerase [Phycisphaerae bacterium]